MSEYMRNMNGDPTHPTTIELPDDVWSSIEHSTPDVYTYPKPIEAHLLSLHDLVGEMFLDQTLESRTARLMEKFVDRHDVGYVVPFERLQRDNAVEIVGRLTEELSARVDPREPIQYILDNRDNPTASRTIGHGLIGLIENTQYYTQQGLEPNKAFGLATLFAAHHPGFPITMVSGFLGGNAAIPIELRAPLLIDNAGQDAELLRIQLIRIGAANLGISEDDAAKIAILGYGLDRISAARPPREIDVIGPMTVSVIGGEVWQKKDPLVTADILRENPDPTFEQVFQVIGERITEEANCAVLAAIAAGQEDIAWLLADKAKEVLAATQLAHTEALTALKELGLSGRYSMASQEMRVAYAAYRQALRANHMQQVAGLAKLIASGSTL